MSLFFWIYLELRVTLPKYLGCINLKLIFHIDERKVKSIQLRY